MRFTIPDDLRGWIGRGGPATGSARASSAATTAGDSHRRRTATSRPSGALRRASAPPSVVRLHIAYRLCKGVRPKFVYAQDSGSMRDQATPTRRAARSWGVRSARAHARTIVESRHSGRRTGETVYRVRAVGNFDGRRDSARGATTPPPGCAAAGDRPRALHQSERHAVRRAGQRAAARRQRSLRTSSSAPMKIRRWPRIASFRSSPKTPPRPRQKRLLSMAFAVEPAPQAVRDGEPDLAAAHARRQQCRE
jgi:hypothetical protein